jgi:hypothetical protein
MTSSQRSEPLAMPGPKSLLSDQVFRALRSPLVGLALGLFGLAGTGIWLTTPTSVRLSCQLRAAFVLDCRQESYNPLGIRLQQRLLAQSGSLGLIPEDPSAIAMHRLTLLGGSGTLNLAPFPVAYGEAIQLKRWIADWQDQPLGFRHRIQIQAPSLLRLGIPLGSVVLLSAGAGLLLRRKRGLADGI